MDPQTIDKLIAFLKDVSPLLLVAGKQQVAATIANSIVGIAWTSIALMASVAGTRWLIRWNIARVNPDANRFFPNDDTRFFVNVFVGIAIAVAAGVSLIVLTSTIGTLINYVVAPDYYTIKSIIELAK